VDIGELVWAGVPKRWERIRDSNTRRRIEAFKYNLAVKRELYYL
jgi:hypothetical protein